MVCRITSIKKRRTSGMTLLELMVASTVGTILLTAILLLSLFASRSFAAMVNYVGLSSSSRIALDNLSRDVRQVKSVSSYTTNSITFVDYDDGSLTYTYDPTAKTLTRTKGTSSKVL